MIYNQIDTPCLIIDMDNMDFNIKTMMKKTHNLGLNLRPHTKAHKNPDIAKAQILAGAKGICVAKLGEAEVMADAGIDDILITTPIAGEVKTKRLISLYKKNPNARFIQVIDNKAHAIEINKEAEQENVCVQLLIEVESGQNRCGVEVGEELLDLIKLINSLDNVSYVGLQAYSGHLQHIKGFESRNNQAREAVLPLFNYLKEKLIPNGFKPEIISGGGTGTYQAYSGLEYTEIQAGSYVFMDSSYLSIGDETNQDSNNEFKSALSVIATVISTPTRERAIIDAGMKSLSIDSGMATVLDNTNLIYQTGGDEHGIIHAKNKEHNLNIGDRIVLVPSHCDTTLNNFDFAYCVRENKVINKICIEGRGRSD
ncbi:DSD1 family PLP-dependent enzyme [Vibrio sagamiensis]|uniref:Metal-activated pyridoxal enzyme n=1 Tax=Vibrio sagamiensis NBRC 104589 TaxID=1219064 RepID=A0A511QER3_9VIBR|nr:DSD1 family PLP-dependent enzyme [Vibrio sagamiensis]GEM74942.1 metal-activated pyridoxal enzyme [Vibrio sagamiensis NBRC 104589]